MNLRFCDETLELVRAHILGNPYRKLRTVEDIIRNRSKIIRLAALFVQFLNICILMTLEPGLCTHWLKS
jgi:hypothetical protein